MGSGQRELCSTNVLPKVVRKCCGDEQRQECSHVLLGGCPSAAGKLYAAMTRGQYHETSSEGRNDS